MERAGDFLSIALRRMQDRRAATFWLRAQWPSLIGETLAAHLRLLSCVKSALRLEADSREWKNQAEAMEQQLRERINQAWGEMLVREVHVELAAPGGRLPYEIDNNHVPFLRAKPKS